MIKLIASDMDGTLFDAPMHVPPITYDIIHALYEEGIRFCASSGRMVCELEEVFAPVYDEMDFVCSNGAEVICGGELVSREIFSHEALIRLGEVVNQFDCMHLHAHTQECTYVFDPPQKFETLEKPIWYARPMVNEIPGPEVDIWNGVVICTDLDIIPDLVYVLTLECGDLFTFAWTGSRGIDFMPRHVSKANGLKKIMRHYGVTADEVVAYGDSMNDYDILRFVGHPVVMENGLYGVKQIAERTIGTFEDYAVQGDMARVWADIHREKFGTLEEGEA